MKTWLKQHWQYLLNIYLFVNFAGWSCWQTYQYVLKEQLGYIEVSFALQSLLMAIVFLVRRPHQRVDPNVWHQAVAALAFISGAGFMGQAPTGGPLVQSLAQGIIFIANILAVVNVLTLGRSFGVFIAFRGLKTGGVYGIVRHPMYATDMLLRCGFFISHANAVTLIVLVGTITCYVVRALLEERFLSQQSDYQEYMQRVRYRFIPALL